MSAYPWTGKLWHDRDEFADWGWIRDESGSLIIVVQLPFSPHSPEAEEHRKNRTDPTQPRVDAILSAINAPTIRDPLHVELADALQAMLTASVVGVQSETTRARNLAVAALASFHNHGN